jgi:hypothetical protein
VTLDDLRHQSDSQLIDFRSRRSILASKIVMANRDIFPER